MHEKSVKMENQISETNQNEIVCKQCAAKLRYKPGTTMLVCDFCGFENEIEIKSEPVEELNFEEWLAKAEQGDGTVEVHAVLCNACGAEISMPENVVSDNCPFCGNHLVITAESHKKLLKPKSLLPFKIDQKTALSAYEKWLRKLWWAPPGLKQFARISEKINGIYIPYWTYDSDTHTKYTGKRGDDYTETERYIDDDGKSQTRTVTRTRWTAVKGAVDVWFDDVLVPASNALPSKIIEKLEPWDVKELIPFDGKFLSGFRTESYQVTVKDGFDRAKNKMEPVIRTQIIKQIGGDRQTISTMNTDYANITFKHVLLPLWISAYKYKNKSYRFLINARTGEVSGERPYCWWKIALAILAAIGILVLLFYLVK